jgi:sigma-B regulation protein RsbU (phosphoserine phosphatase)
VLILVVERDPYIQALEARLLESWGYESAFAPDGVAALDMAHKLLPRLLISEILVPKLDGLRVCREVKRDPLTRHIKVLIFSELLAERRAHEAGADVFLRKPLDKNAFLKAVEELLGVPKQRSAEKRDG